MYIRAELPAIRKYEMTFTHLQKEIDDLFHSTSHLFDNPFQEYNEIRRRTLEILDEHQPGNCLCGDSEEGMCGAQPSSSGNQQQNWIQPHNGGNLPDSQRQWMVPRCDFHNEAKRYIIQAELPGMNKEDIHLDVDDETNSITISAKRHDESKSDRTEAGEKIHSSKSHTYSFHHTFKLPFECHKNLNNMQAEFNDGMLCITCPKGQVTPNRSPRSIPVQ
ncbi:putative HSP20 family protein [Blattamonas nauphoetae]|uniref:HSP20 family protein n=1 Tax=Blattamonas nauphoetae TaxID=2049346 RepID=A0ABQ9XR94_9EUKA|nr:putative HSP20 family protein [Blattamonas nauphoetae]